ncbi:MAG TPA: O-antigen ligase family protein [Thermoanaerobaculia bacterium]|nr:O-antigen ligase family protein [Thermoanaerobaculia bacterium]
MGAVALLVIATPLVMVPDARDAFALPKLMVAETLGLASLLLLACGLWRVERVDPRRLLRHPAVLAVAPALAIASVGWLTSDHPLHVRRALVDLWIGASCLVGWSLALRRATLRRLLDLLLIPAVLLSLLAALQFYGVFQPFRFGMGAHSERLEVTSLAGNPGDLAAFLVLPALVAQAGLVRPGSRRWLWGAGLALCAYGLAVTQTLTSLAALAIGSLVLWIAWLPRRRLLLGVASVATATALLVLAVAPLRGRVADRVAGVQRGEAVNEILSGRIDGWRAAAWMVRHHPWAGVGHGAYRAEFVPAKLALLAAGQPFLPGHASAMFVNAHGEYFEVAAEWGFPGALALLWGIGVLLATAGRRCRGGRASVPSAGECGLLCGGIAALAVVAAGYFPFRLALTAYPALLLLAWALAAAEEPE